MLRVAVPNKGILSEAATDMLSEAGYSTRRGSKTLVHRDETNGVEFFYLRPRDIAVYVGSGILDAGITGRDLLLESQAPAEEVVGLGFGSSRFFYAGEAGRFSSVDELAGLRIATSFPHLVQSDLKARGIEATTVQLDGAIEVSIQLGVADAVADVVETGSTLRAAGLETFGEPLLDSEAVLVQRDGADSSVEVLRRRLESVMVARQYVLVDYNIEERLVPEAIALTPGLESPTVSPLQETGWVAVRVMVEAKDVNNVMDRLYAVGARAILVTSIGACRI
ncbi:MULTISPECIES: ATP phosphoribosyltransferase [Brevibacterium]|uniref:ATP phosphoribosyltransferase n=3 Tax=Brevibacterium casei TaxID=33889 RepID=K9AZI5_9MICO|nr:ATP phosphoribosyltransferase [Brevibacterium casei]NJE68302.1 ATP phosphoribosyltransferase [Brevibacterium sp. LS14]EKU47947.1 ATP phosphoribosyltransferase [Brevibacterium casei S18]KZE18184.1 ATP phosphoribosyltransferase [Brevibacterium casei]MCT1446007.1 ATP phosphoribosyltransferase [Brevibacterium casei]MCT1549083.1 ATP phosphoribosyltransferase [Brevibacterium casei]